MCLDESARTGLRNRGPRSFFILLDDNFLTVHEVDIKES